MLWGSRDSVTVRQRSSVVKLLKVNGMKDAIPLSGLLNLYFDMNGLSIRLI